MTRNTCPRLIDAAKQEELFKLANDFLGIIKHSVPTATYESSVGSNDFFLHAEEVFDCELPVGIFEK